MTKTQVRAFPYGLQPNLTSRAKLESLGEESWRLMLPSGPARRYRLAQMDNYNGLERSRFPHQPPFKMSLRARASAVDIPGTWGFGLWNDPFAMGLLSGGGGLRLPALPQAAWFFFASSECYLSLQDDLPACGALAGTFRSGTLSFSRILKILPPALLFPLRAARRRLRSSLSSLVAQDAAALSIDPREWHTYEMIWELEAVTFRVDGNTTLETHVSPRPPLGLVLWVDNQYAAWHPDGRMRYGFLSNPEPVWVEINHLRVEDQR